MLWGDKPVLWTILGAIIIAISRIFILLRETSGQSTENNAILL